MVAGLGDAALGALALEGGLRQLHHLQYAVASSDVARMLVTLEPANFHALRAAYGDAARGAHILQLCHRQAIELAESAEVHRVRVHGGRCFSALSCGRHPAPARARRVGRAPALRAGASNLRARASSPPNPHPGRDARTRHKLI